MKNKIITIFAITTSILLFQNCSAFNGLRGESTLAGSCTGDGGTPTVASFEASYHPFFQTNCASCHTSGGLKGDSPFGDPDSSVAFAAFEPLGPATIDAKLAQGHQGFNYDTLKPDLDNALALYQPASEEGSCLDDGEGVTSEAGTAFFEDFTSIDGTGAEYFAVLPEKLDGIEILEYNLGESSFVPRLPGVSIRMEVSVRYTNSVEVPRRPTGYLVQNIEVKSLESVVEISDLEVLLNGDSQQVSTFKSIDAVVIQGDFWTPISGTSVGFFESLTPANFDIWQLRINGIAVQ